VTRRERFGLTLLVGALVVVYVVPALLRHRNFDTSYDLAIFDQAVWHLSRFEAPGSTLSGHSNILGDHFYPIIGLFTLPYWLAPSPATLIVTQAVLLGLSAIPVWLFVRRRVPTIPTFCVTAAYGLFWGMQRTAMLDVHEMAFAPLLIAIAILAADRRSWTTCWIACAGVILVKEDLIPFVAGLGAYLIATGERRRGLILIGVSAAVFVLVTSVVIPFFNDSGVWSVAGSFDTVLRRPWTAPMLLVTPPEKLRTVLIWLSPFLFLPIASPVGLMLIPIAAERLLSDVPSHWLAGGHYTAPLAPILAMAAGDALGRLSRRISPASHHRGVIAIAAGMALFSAIIPGRQPHWRLFTPRHYAPRPSLDAAYRALGVIPETASVVAQAAIAPRLAHRHRLYLLQAGAPDADYVIAAMPLDTWPVPDATTLTQLLDDRRQRGYITVFDESGWIVLRRPN
jgi:uncharacterized membrane protein